MQYLFYDYETTGLNEKYDQIVQFAAIRTDEEFNIIDEPIDILCKLRNDILPSPYAFLVTKIDIDKLQENGLDEFEFAKIINKAMLGNGNQRIIGYNSKEFDDKMTRFLFYRNFYNAYAWTYEGNNQTWDLIDIVRMGYSFDKLNGINFNDNGKDTLKLENLSRLNSISHSKAHDALSDVHATIGLLEKINQENPKLIQYYQTLFDSRSNLNMIKKNELIYHISYFYGYKNKFISLLMPICKHPQFDKSYIMWDLSKNPEVLVTKNIDEINEIRFKKKEEKEFENGLLELKLNQKPTIIKYNKKNIHPNIDKELCLNNWKKVKANMDKLKLLADQFFTIEIEKEDPDADLYYGEYFNDYQSDKKNLEMITTNPKKIKIIKIQSKRFKEQLERFEGRNYYDDLSDEWREEYDSYLKNKLLSDDLGEKWMTFKKFDLELDEIIGNNELSEEDEIVLEKLTNFVESKRELISKG